MTIGFLGIGRMGEPMARRLLQSGQALWIWSRNPRHAASLQPDGARLATSVEGVFANCETVLLMLRDEHAIDSVLKRGTAGFAAMTQGHRLVQMGTVDPLWSQQLASDLAATGARYVEAPVSGSRSPAERGELIGMLAGTTAEIGDLELLLAPVCQTFIRCGNVPEAMQLKLAVNHYLVGMVCVLAEAVQSAARTGIPLSRLATSLGLGPMASEVMRGKLAQFVSGDFAARASIADVTHVAELVLAQAERAHAPSPLLQQCLVSLLRARADGRGDLDMAAVLPVPITIPSKSIQQAGAQQ